MGPASSPQSPSGPVKNGWGRAICITAWQPSPHCGTHIHLVEQQNNKAALCTTGVITHSSPEREPGMSKKAVMDSRLQITKGKNGNSQLKVQSSPDTYGPLTASLVSYLYTGSLRTFPSLLVVTLLSNGIYWKLCYGRSFSHNAYKDPCKDLCRYSSVATRMPKGLFDVCFHLEDAIC